MGIYHDLDSGIRTAAQIQYMSREMIETPAGNLKINCDNKHWQWPLNANSIMDAFHAHMAFFWTWNPAITNNQAAANLLDGIPASGMCGLLAHAFRIFLHTPQPFGYGLDCQTSEYEPIGSDIFISKHPGTFFGLHANIVNNTGNALLPFYAWGNHIVVSCGGRFYDPCYNLSYAIKEEMALYKCKYNGEVVKGKGMLLTTVTARKNTGQSVTLKNINRPADSRAEVKNAADRFPLAMLVAPQGFS